MPLEIALNSQVRKAHFPPAPTRNWAYQASTRGFIDVPFGGFLGPPSETAFLTRILRRCLAHTVYHASHKYTTYSVYANYNFLKKVTGKNCCFCQNTTQEQLTFPVAAPA
jgi:hypothetical protein